MYRHYDMLKVWQEPFPCQECPRREECQEACLAWQEYVETGRWDPTHVARDLAPLGKW